MLICPDRQTNRDTTVSAPQLMLCPHKPAAATPTRTRSQVNRRSANPHPTHKTDRHPRAPKEPFCTHTYSPNRTRLELTQAGKAYTRPAICIAPHKYTHTRQHTHGTCQKNANMAPCAQHSTLSEAATPTHRQVKAPGNRLLLQDDTMVQQHTKQTGTAANTQTYSSITSGTSASM